MLSFLLLLPLLAQEPSLQEAEQLAQSAATLLQQGEPDEAAELLKRALAIQEQQLEPTDPSLGRTLFTLSFALSQAGRHDEAMAVGERALQAAELVGEPSPGLAMIQRNLAEIAAQAGRFAEARRFADDAVSTYDAVYGKTPMAAEAREFAAKLAHEAGDLAAAEEHLTWALGTYEKLLGPTDPATTTRPILSLNALLERQGKLDAALLLGEYGTAILEAAGMEGSPPWSAFVGQAVDLLESLGERSEAGLVLEQLVGDRMPELGDADNRESVQRLGFRWAKLGFPGRAQEIFESLVRTRSDDALFEVGNDIGLAQTLAVLGEWDSALAAVDAALATVVEQEDARLAGVVAELTTLRARCLRGLDREEEGLDSLKEVFVRMREDFGEDHPALTDTLLSLVRAEAAAHGATVELLDLLDMSEECLRNTPPIQLASLFDNQWWTELRMPASAWNRGWLQLAEANAKRMPAAFQALDRQRERARLQSVAWWLERGAALADVPLANYLGLIAADFAGAVPQAERKDYRQQRDELEARLWASGSHWASLVAPRGATLEAARSGLTGPGERLLLFFWTGEEAWAWLVGPKAEQDRLARLGSCDELGPLLVSAQEGLRDLAATCDLGELSARLLHPLWEELSSAVQITVVADGPLAFLPFEALATPGGEPWALRARVRYATTVARELAVRSAAKGERSDIVDVVPTAPHPEDPAVHQLRRLRGRFSAVPGSGPSMARGEVVPDDRLRIGLESALHAAAAGGQLRGLRLLDFRAPVYLDAEVPTATGIVLSPETAGRDLPAWHRENGFLSLPELHELSLDADVVLLPVAELGPQPASERLRAEGAHELVNAFLASGARSVVLSLWTLGDPVVERFDATLRRAISEADEPHRALWDTQRDWLERALRDGNQRLLHPGVWARLRSYGS